MSSRELIQLIKSVFGTKFILLNFLEEEFSLNFSPKWTYNHIIEELQKRGKEKNFCEKVFKMTNFKDALRRYELISGLSLLIKKELLSLTKILSENEKKWSIKKQSYQSIFVSIPKTVSKEEIDEAIMQMYEQNLIERGVIQQDNWVIGPFGIMHSKMARKFTEIEDIRRLLLDHLNYNLSKKFSEQLKLLPVQELKKDDSLWFQKFFQIVLSKMNNSEIFQAINHFLQKGLLKTPIIRHYWDFVVTPYGVFEKGENGVEGLSDILLKLPKNQLEKISEENIDIELKVLKKCITDPPDAILNELFGLFDLQKIASNLDLVCVDKISKKDLIEIILLRIGFIIPPKLEGITTLIESLEGYLVRLDSEKITQEIKTGIMMEFFSKTEAILKDIIYFYVSFLWNELISEEFELEKKKEISENIIKKEFNIRKNVGNLTLGQLIGLIKDLNNRIKTDKELGSAIKNEFNREFLLDKDDISILEELPHFRPFEGHDKKIGRQRIKLDLKICIDLISKIIGLLKKLKNKGYYPTLLRITREITNEYGTTFLQAVDEKGKEFTIKARSWIRTEHSLFMHSKTKKISVHPFIIERFW